jgi:hypothetical protein
MQCHRAEAVPRGGQDGGEDLCDMHRQAVGSELTNLGAATEPAGQADITHALPPAGRADQPLLAARHHLDMRAPRTEYRGCGASDPATRARDDHGLACMGGFALAHTLVVPDISIGIPLQILQP